MSRIIDDLLRKPDFGITALVRNLTAESVSMCRGVQVTEHMDPSPWLHKHEIVITTGISLDTEAKQRTFIGELVKAESLGLIYSSFHAVPRSVIRLCEEHGLTLLSPPPTLPVADMSAFINRRILDRHFESLQSSIKLYRQLVASVIRGATIQRILDIVIEALGVPQAVVIDREGIVLAEFGDSTELYDFVADIIRNHRERISSRGSHFPLPDEESICHIVQVQLDHETHAFIAVAGSTALNDHEKLLIEQLHAGIALTLSRDLTDKWWRQQHFTRLLEAVHMGEMSSVLVQERLRAANIDADAEGILFRVTSDTEDFDLQRLIRLLENELIGYTDTVTPHRDAVFFFVPDPPEELGERVYQRLSNRGAATVIASMRHSGADGFVRAYQEVHMLAQQQMKVSGFFAAESMDTLTILRSNHDPMLQALVSRTIGPLFDSHGNEKPELLQTLETFIKHGCRTGPAAEELYVHRHTVTYRLNQITQLVGLDPRLGETLLEYTAALRLYRAGVVKPEDLVRGRSDKG